ncbi:MAG: 30S ribosomal protein S12 methylthiotransferase RimO [Candidatus Omnitrophota bacterium]
MKSAKVGIISLGCPRNLVDSESMLGRLTAKGYKIVDIQDADIGLVNTCSFIDEAKKESVDAILELVELKKEGRLKRIIVAGCLSQRYKAELLSNLSEVDAFVGRLEFEDGLSYKKYPLTAGHTAYLKISEGCNHSCSFCVIPKIKGRLKSRAAKSIIEEVKRLDEEKKAEINIIGQDISMYGLDIDKKLSLSGLLTKIIGALNNVRWLRLLYLHPENLTPDLIRLIAQEPKICKYVDLPLQHINRRVLKAMKRPYDKKKIIPMLSDLRQKIPTAAIRTSLIVGFPGETDREFKELISFVKEQRFERLGVFRYSREEGTAAYDYPHQVPEKIKKERFDLIMREQKVISEENNREFLGKTLEVLIDEKESEGNYAGRLEIDAPEVDGSVYVRADKALKPGDFVKVKITDAYEYDLHGEQICTFT